MAISLSILNAQLLVLLKIQKQTLRKSETG